MHHFTHICICTNSQLIHTATSVQKPLPPLGTVAFLHFSRFSQSLSLPSHAAIKRGRVFQDLTTWREAIMLINYISIQLRSVPTQFYGSINTITSTPVPQIQVLCCNYCKAAQSHSVDRWGTNAGPWPPGHPSSHGLTVPGSSLPTYVRAPRILLWLAPAGRNQQN